MDRSCKGLRPPDLHGWPRIKAILVTSLSHGDFRHDFFSVYFRFAYWYRTRLVSFYGHRFSQRKILDSCWLEVIDIGNQVCCLFTFLQSDMFLEVISCKKMWNINSRKWWWKEIRWYDLFFPLLSSSHDNRWHRVTKTITILSAKISIMI